MKSFFWSILLLCAIACSKGSGKEKDYEAPIVTLNTPTDNQVFSGGQNIMIAGSVTDNKYIKEIHIEVTNLANATEYLHVHIHPGTHSFNFNQAFALQAGIAYKIRVIVDDASTNSTIKSVEISCN